MKGFAAGCRVVVLAMVAAVVLSGCLSAQAYREAYLFSDDYRQSFTQSHIARLQATEPWMTDAQMREHASATFVEVQQVLFKWERTGQLLEPTPIPLPSRPDAAVAAAEKSAPAAAAKAPAPEAVASVAAPVSAKAAAPVAAKAPAAESPVAVKAAAAPAPTPAAEPKAPPVPSGLAAGQFQLEGGNYRIRVSQEGRELVVTEPNRVTRYAFDGKSRYTYRHPDHDRTYYLAIVDPNRLRAGVVGSDRSDILRRIDTAPSVNPHQAIAEKYLALANSDKTNTQAWTFCAAVANERALKSAEQFQAFAREAAQRLQLIAVGKSNPCPDAIPAEVW